jgi:hypothetical protein
MIVNYNNPSLFCFVLLLLLKISMLIFLVFQNNILNSARKIRCPTIKKVTTHFVPQRFVPYIMSHSFRPTLISSRSPRPCSFRPEFILSHTFRPFLFVPCHFVPNLFSLIHYTLKKRFFLELSKKIS